MKIILKIFKNDLIGIKGSILTIVLSVGLCILPALYAWFNICLLYTSDAADE